MVEVTAWVSGCVVEVTGFQCYCFVVVAPIPFPANVGLKINGCTKLIFQAEPTKFGLSYRKIYRNTKSGRTSYKMLD